MTNLSARPRSRTQTLRIALKVISVRLLTPISSLLARLALRSWGADIGDRLCVRGRIRVHNSGQLTLGNDVRINSGSANFVGGDRRMAFWVGSRGALTIGNGCALSNSTIVCRHQVRIGDEAFIGGGCEIYDNDFHQIDPAERVNNEGPIGEGPIEIGPRTFIGARCLVLKNVTIGEGAVVGAGSVVTRSIPAFEIWAGAPARFVRKIAAPSNGSDQRHD